MSIAESIQADHENAQNSNGTRTEEGKQTPSRSAVTHSLSGRIAFLCDEDRLLYAARHTRLLREMEPVTLFEEDLVHTIADSQWQIHQYRAHDQRIRLELLAENDVTETQSIRQDIEAKDALDKLARYAARQARALYQAIQEFEKQKKARLAAARARAIEQHEEATGSVFQRKWHCISVPNGFDLQKCVPFQALQEIRFEILRRRAKEEAESTPQAG